MSDDVIAPLATKTPNFGLNLPDVGGSWDVWGDETNANWNFIDSTLLPIYGGAMTGYLVLYGDPTVPLGAATRQYVDAKAGAYLPLAGGVLAGGLHFGGATAPGGAADLSRHIDLYNATFGISISSARLNIVADGSTVFVDQASATDLFVVNNTEAYSYVPLVVDRALIADPNATVIQALKPVTLPADPTTALQAATKQYVDGKTAGSGVSSFNTRSGAVTLTTADVTGAGGAPAANPTFTGAVNAPTPALSGNTLVATTAYVSTNAAMLTSQSGGTVDYNAIDQAHFGLHNYGGPLTSTTNQPPGIASPAKSTVLSAWTANTGWATQLYMGAEAGVPNLFYRVMPGNATWASWARIITDQGGAMTGPLTQAADPTAPLGTATKQYVDAVATAANENTGRNLVHNPLFNVQQRGVGPFAANNLYTADRWLVLLNTDAASVFPQAAGDSARAQAGDEAMTQMLRNNFTGNAAAGAFNMIAHRIEGVRRLAGKTVTVSFFAQGSAALNLGCNFTQAFGTGGSPSASVAGNGQAVVTSAVWQRYSLTFAIPSAAAHTLGTNGDDYTQLGIWFSSGATNAAQAGNVGVQSGTMSLWGVQVEVAAKASALEKPEPRIDLANCQRFAIAYAGNVNAGVGATGPGVNAYMQIWLPVTMRATPTITNLVWGANTNVSAFGCTSASPSGAIVYGTAAAAGNCLAQLNGALFSSDL